MKVWVYVLTKMIENNKNKILRCPRNKGMHHRFIVQRKMWPCWSLASLDSCRLTWTWGNTMKKRGNWSREASHKKRLICKVLPQFLSVYKSQVGWNKAHVTVWFMVDIDRMMGQTWLDTHNSYCNSWMLAGDLGWCGNYHTPKHTKTINYRSVFGLKQIFLSDMSGQAVNLQPDMSSFSLSLYRSHRIGWWEILQESPIFDAKNNGFL